MCAQARVPSVSRQHFRMNEKPVPAQTVATNKVAASAYKDATMLLALRP